MGIPKGSEIGRGCNISVYYIMLAERSFRINNQDAEED